MRPRTPLKRLLTHPATLWGPGLWSCLLQAERGRDFGDCRPRTMLLATSWAPDNARLRDSDKGNCIVCEAYCGGRSL